MDEDFAGSLGCALIFLPVTILGLVLYGLHELWKTQTEAVQKMIIKYSIIIVTLPAWAIARISLMIWRDSQVFGYRSMSEKTEEQLVIWWLIGVPLLGMAPVILIVAFLINEMEGMILEYALNTVVLVPIWYYWFYFNDPPKVGGTGIVHHNWPRFEAAMFRLILKWRLFKLFQGTRFELWFAEFKEQYDSTFRSEPDNRLRSSPTQQNRER